MEILFHASQLLDRGLYVVDLNAKLQDNEMTKRDKQQRPGKTQEVRTSWVTVVGNLLTSSAPNEGRLPGMIAAAALPTILVPPWNPVEISCQKRRAESETRVSAYRDDFCYFHLEGTTCTDWLLSCLLLLVPRL